MSESFSVGMLTPAFWPEVRRGTERMVHEVTRELIARGHPARVITSHRGPPGTGEEEGVPVLRVPRPPDGRLRRRALEDYMTHVPLSYAALRATHPDIAHAWFTTDALAAARYRRVTGRPAVHSYMGIPDHAGLMWKRKRLEITLRAIRETDVTVALSRHAAGQFRRWLGYDARIIPPPVDIETFRPQGERSDVPTAICAAALDDADGRKRVDLLIRAWPLVSREKRGAQLLLNKPRNPVADTNGLPDGIAIVDMDERRELARLYASAWTSVLPSRNEAFGLVLAEAMACGTPGVGSNRDGIPEVIESPEIGRLFDGEDETALARAIVEAFELAEDPATADACRKRALRLSTQACTDAYEQLYRELLAERA